MGYSVKTFRLSRLLSVKLTGPASVMLGSLVFALATPVSASAACARPEGAFIFGLTPISKITANSAELHGGVNPKGCETSWQFEYSTSLSKLESGEGTVVAGGGTISAGEADNKFHAASGVATGLSGGTLYFVRLFAENVENGKAEEKPLAFETRGKPAVVTFAVHSVDGEAMRALGSVAPNGLDTHYRVQYVTQHQFEETAWSGATETPELDAGVGAESRHPIETKGIKTWPSSIEDQSFGSKIVGADMPGLGAGAYRYRLVASNEQGVGVGDEQTLTVPGVGLVEEPSCQNSQFRTGPSAGLPDCRGYEQVTPADKRGAEDTFSYAATFKTGARVGEDGEHVTLSQTGLQWGPSSDPVKGNYFFTRTPDGWQMASARPSGEAGPLSYQATLFGADLTDLGVEASWSTGEAIQSQSPDVEFMSGSPGGPYVSVPPVPRKQVGSEGGWVAASEDLGKMILQVEDHTLLGHSTGTSKGYDLYESSEGQLRQVNAGIGSCGAHIVKGLEGYPGQFGQESISSPHAVSTDGSRVFFEATPGSNCSEPAHLYMRVNGMATVDVGVYDFVAANRRGTSVLFENNNAGTNEIGLYDTVGRTATHLFSAHEALAGGGKMIVSKEFSGESGVIYLFSYETLTPEAPGLSEANEDVGPGPQNLYRYDLGKRELRFVAQVGTELQSGGGVSVSPDGRYFYFTSMGVAGVAPEERQGPDAQGNIRTFRYDDSENLVQCMSCASSFDPAPSGQASFLPENIRPSADGVPDLRVASDNGDYVFFDTTAPLLLQDIDGEVEAGTYNSLEGNHDFEFSASSDVYEWRKLGVEGCVHVQGCLALISSGAGGLRNVLLGTTPSGRDVFFASHSVLVGQDNDTAGDVYDARIGGGFPAPLARPVECEENACQRPLAAPIDTTPASLAFSGPGNPVPVLAAGKSKIAPKSKSCRKGQVRRGARCVKQSCRKGLVRRGARCVKLKRGVKSTGRSAVKRNGGRGK